MTKRKMKTNPLIRAPVVSLGILQGRRVVMAAWRIFSNRKRPPIRGSSSSARTVGVATGYRFARPDGQRVVPAVHFDDLFGRDQRPPAGGDVAASLEFPPRGPPVFLVGLVSHVGE